MEVVFTTLKINKKVQLEVEKQENNGLFAPSSLLS